MSLESLYERGKDPEKKTRVQFGKDSRVLIRHLNNSYNAPHPGSLSFPTEE